MYKLFTVIGLLFLSACQLSIAESDGSIIIDIIDSSIDASLPVDSSVVDSSTVDSSIVMDSSVPVDSSVVFDSSMGMDSQVADASMDAVAPMDAMPIMDVVIPMDTSMMMDAMVMDTGINVSAIPVGSAGYSTVRIQSTTEQPVPNQDVGAFRTDCDYSHMKFDDPIVSPGKPGASHLHTFFGNTLTDAFSTPDSLLNTGNSTCRGGIINRSAYWIPSMIDGNGNPLASDYHEFYYKSGYDGVKPADIVSFPQGLKIIAGYKSGGGSARNGVWGCLNNYIGWHSTIQDCPAGDKIITQVVFPQCWDGVNLDSSDHRSHMAYGNGSGCPSTHPIAFPQITYSIGWPVNSKAGLKLSSDIMYGTDPGASIHGDYIAAWQQSIEDQWVKYCVHASANCHSHLLGNNQMMIVDH